MNDNGHFLNKDSYLTVRHASSFVGKSPETVRRMCREGKIKASLVGSQWNIPASSLNKITGFKTKPNDSNLFDLNSAYDQISSELKDPNTTYPDVILHQDQLMDKVSLLSQAHSRLGSSSGYEFPALIAVPKNKLFSRSIHDLSVTDRLAYSAATNVLSDEIDSLLIDTVFSARKVDSKGSRTSGWKRWRSTSVALTDQYPNGFVAISTDITSFFGYIQHGVLYDAIRLLNNGDKVIEALKPMLKKWTELNIGLPIGPDASRLLANYYLSQVDETISRLPGISYTRFMDDIIIIGHDMNSSRNALEELSGELQKLGLVLASGKTHIYTDKEALTNSFGDPELGSLAYSLRWGISMKKSVALLSRILMRALKNPRRPNRDREFRFALWKLLYIPIPRMRSKIIKHYQDFIGAPQLVSRYISAGLPNKRLEVQIEEFLNVPLRNSSPFLCAWLFAGIIDAGKTSDGICRYALSVAKDQNNPYQFRAVAIGVLALSTKLPVRSILLGFIANDSRPAIKRSAVIALAKRGDLKGETLKRLSAYPELSLVIKYCAGRSKYPRITGE